MIHFYILLGTVFLAVKNNGSPSSVCSALDKNGLYGLKYLFVSILKGTVDPSWHRRKKSIPMTV